MNGLQKEIWTLALPYLKKGVRKDFVLHTKTVLSALKLLLKHEAGDKHVLIPAAILHDTGWSRVPIHLQKATEKHAVRKSMIMHLEYSAPIIEEILRSVDFDKKQAERVLEIVLSHKFCNPRNLDKRLLIDADTLSDIFKEQFYSDAHMFNMIPRDFIQIRMKNQFYTLTARKIFLKELKKRADELGLSV